MRYLMFIKHPESIRAESQPQALMAAMGAYVTEGFKSCKFLADALQLQQHCDTRFHLN